MTLRKQYLTHSAEIDRCYSDLGIRIGIRCNPAAL